VCVYNLSWVFFSRACDDTHVVSRRDFAPRTIRIEPPRQYLARPQPFSSRVLINLRVLPTLLRLRNRGIVSTSRRKFKNAKSRIRASHSDEPRRSTTPACANRAPRAAAAVSYNNISYSNDICGYFQPRRIDCRNAR